MGFGGFQTHVAKVRTTKTETKNVLRKNILEQSIHIYVSLNRCLHCHVN